MLDYFKLLELDTNCNAKEVKEKYLEKLASISSENPHEYSIKRHYFEEAFLTLSYLTKKSQHELELKEFYNNHVNLKGKITFSDDSKKNDKIIKKIESAMIEHLITDKDNDFEKSFSKFVCKFNKNHSKKVKEIDKNVILTTINIYPYFKLNYDLVNSNKHVNKVMAKV